MHPAANIALILFIAVFGSALARISPKIYVATSTGGVHAVSIESHESSVIINSPNILYGITFDTTNQKLYFSNDNIYRTSADGSDMETVFNTGNYGWTQGLAFDSVTGNIYGVHYAGYVFVCDTKINNSSLTCATIVSTENAYAFGIALDLPRGQFYWTQYVGRTSSLMRANMDGSNVTEIISFELSDISGVAVDSEGGRLYWTNAATSQILSCNLEGGDVRMRVQLEEGVGPWGILLYQNRFYWGTLTGGKVQTFSREGAYVQTLYATPNIVQLTVVETDDDTYERVARENPCAASACSHICVIASAGKSRCLCPEGLSLNADERTCT